MVLGRFFAVGLACALLTNVMLIAGEWAGAHYAVSTLVAFAAVAALGYWLHGAWTFPGTQRSLGSFARYTLSMSANLPLFLAGMFLGVDLAGLPVALAAPIVTVLLWLFNFAAARWALRA